jgi:hypothetical protein
VIDQQLRALKKWLVQFEDAYPGGGVDGDKIWCDDSDFSDVIPPLNEATWRASTIEERLPSINEAKFSDAGENGHRERSRHNGTAVLS